jgi:hypothetical protein
VPIMVERIVVFPRYTTLVGTTLMVPSYFTDPRDVRRFAKVLLTGWRGTGSGDPPADLEFVVQDSGDLDVWYDRLTFSPASAGAEATAELDLRLPWLRFGVALSGDDPSATCWLNGILVPRSEGPRSEGPRSEGPRREEPGA